MGRKSLKKDRAYLTTTEWASEWGGYKDRSQKPFRQLPFYCCAISFTPFEDPVSSLHFQSEQEEILMFIQQFGRSLPCH